MPHENQQYLARYNVRVHGSGDQTVVLGHGIGTDQGAWDRQVPELVAAGCRVVTFDFAGATAGTARFFNAGRYRSMHGLAEDVLAVMRALEITSAVYVGHSMGGMAGLLAAQAEPERFSALMLIASSARYLDDPATGYVGGFSSGHVEQLLRSALEDHAQWANGFANAMVSAASPYLSADDFSKALLSLRADVVHCVLGAALRSDHRVDVERLRTPLYVLQASSDAAVPESAAQWLASNGHARKLIHLSVKGHFPHIAAPDEVNRALLECLQDWRRG